MKRYEVVEFTNVGGREVPVRPWPQVFYVSDITFHKSCVEVRPLTATGLVKGVSRNLVTMTWWRLCRLASRIGFLATEPGELYSWSQWRWRFWRVRKWRRAQARKPPLGRWETFDLFEGREWDS